MPIIVNKYMVIVETRNYPVNIISPIIQRYSKIRKRMSSAEIASCLACNATVTLEKSNGIKVKLTKENYKAVLIKYNNELATIEINKSARKEEVNNTAALENLREKFTASTTEDEVAKSVNTVTMPKPSKKKVEVKKEEVDEETTEQAEMLQDDPEDEDKFDSAAFYDSDEDAD